MDISVTMDTLSLPTLTDPAIDICIRGLLMRMRMLMRHTVTTDIVTTIMEYGDIRTIMDFLDILTIITMIVMMMTIMLLESLGILTILTIL